VKELRVKPRDDLRVSTARQASTVRRLVLEPSSRVRRTG